MKIKFGKWFFYFKFKNGYHIMPFNYIKTKKHRFIGYLETYYDGIIYSFGFWFFNISWGY